MKNKKQIVIFLSIFGLLVTLSGLKFIYNAYQSKHWPKAEGVITKSFLDWDRKRGRFANIEYTFTVNGVTFVGFQISTKDTMKSYNELLKEYPLGKKVNVYYDSSNPDNSLLEPGYYWQSFIAFIIGCVMLITAIGIALFYKSKEN